MHALESWTEEKRSAWLYRIVSDTESGTPPSFHTRRMVAATRQTGDSISTAGY